VGGARDGPGEFDFGEGDPRFGLDAFLTSGEDADLDLIVRPDRRSTPG